MRQKIGLDATSDRLELNIKKAGTSPAIISEGMIQRLNWFRKHGFLPPSPENVIINSHSELAAQITSSSSDFVSLGKNLGMLKTSGGEKAQLEPALTTMDFYEINRPNLFTNRLRLYFQDGILVSTRSIIADLTPRAPLTWSRGSFSVNPRSEIIFLTRSDDNPRSSVDRFFNRNQSIEVIILKSVQRINFGEKYMWDHRRAQSEKKVDLTKQQSVLGMGPYIALCLQGVHIHDLQKPLPASEARKYIYDLISNPDKLLAKYKSSPPQTKIEIEAKGDTNQIVSADIANKIFGVEGIFRHLDVKFKFSTQRKVSV